MKFKSNKKSIIFCLALTLAIAVVSSLTCMFSFIASRGDSSSAYIETSDNETSLAIPSSLRLMDENAGKDTSEKFDKDKFNDENDKLTTKPDAEEETTSETAEDLPDEPEESIESSEEVVTPDDSDNSEVTAEPDDDTSDNEYSPEESGGAYETDPDDGDDTEESREPVIDTPDEDITPEESDEEVVDTPAEDVESDSEKADDDDEPASDETDKTEPEKDDDKADGETDKTPAPETPNTSDKPEAVPAGSFSVNISTDMSSAFGKISRTITMKIPADLGKDAHKKIKNALEDGLSDSVTFKTKNDNGYVVYEFTFDSNSIKNIAEISETVLKEKSIVNKKNSIIPFTSATYSEAVTVTELVNILGLSVDSLSVSYCVNGQIIEAENASKGFTEQSDSVKFESEKDHINLSFRYRKINVIRILVYVLVLAVIAAVVLFFVFFPKKHNEDEESINGIRFSEIGSVKVSAKDIKLPEKK